jgi:hypothetical protein
LFASAVDYNRGLAVWIFSGAVNTDADYEGFFRSLEQMLAETSQLSVRIGVIVADPGRPVPSPQWRRRLAEASATIPPDTLIVMVSRSVAVRGAVTAIHWLNPPQYQFAVHDTFAHALAFIEEKREKRIPTLQELHARARVALQGLSTDLLPPRRSIPPPPASGEGLPPARRSIRAAPLGEPFVRPSFHPACPRQLALTGLRSLRPTVVRPLTADAQAAHRGQRPAPHPALRRCTFGGCA